VTTVDLVLVYFLFLQMTICLHVSTFTAQLNVLIIKIAQSVFLSENRQHSNL